jgi:hypothetical protein
MPEISLLVSVCLDTLQNRGEIAPAGVTAELSLGKSRELGFVTSFSKQTK